jgi:type IV secretory pathway TrbL component
MFLPPGTMCQAYQFQSSAAAAQLASLATDGRGVQGASASCRDVQVPAAGGSRRRLLQAITQPELTITFSVDAPTDGAAGEDLGSQIIANLQGRVAEVRVRGVRLGCRV